ncbi:MAG: hypothetical protein ACRDWY_16695, partial [Actinomycetes bacterium]
MLTWPGIEGRLVMVMDGRSLGFVVPASTSAQGLLGNANGDPNDDLAFRDGEVLPAGSSPSVIHGGFADSWRISDADSLFTYGANESTASFTDESFPSNVVTMADFTEAEVAAASTVCVEAGVAPGPQFESCVFDIALTGDDSYADQSALVTDVLVDADAHDFDGSGRLIEDFEGTVGPNFASAYYSEDASTTRVAGPVFDTPGYRFYARNVARHDSIGLGMDLLAYGPVGSDSHEQSIELLVDEEPVATLHLDGQQPQITGTGALSGSIERTSVGQTASGQAVSRFHLEATLTHAMESLDVELRPQNFRGVLDTSLGVDDIGLTLHAPPPQHFAVDLPASVPGASGTSTDPAAGAGNLETPGAEDAYQFTLDGAEPTDLYVARSCSDGIKSALRNENTGTEIVPVADDCSHQRFDAVPPGDYELQIQSLGSATHYTLAVNAIPADASGSFSVDGSPLTLTTVAAGQNGFATFEGTQGQRIQLETSGETVTTTAYWEVSR